MFLNAQQPFSILIPRAQGARTQDHGRLPALIHLLVLNYSTGSAWPVIRYSDKEKSLCWYFREILAKQ